MFEKFSLFLLPSLVLLIISIGTIKRVPVYEEFVEGRCFPRTRDKMKIMLDALELPFYEPIMIIRKTEGRMAEDDFWIKVE